MFSSFATTTSKRRGRLGPIVTSHGGFQSKYISVYSIWHSGCLSPGGSESIELVWGIGVSRWTKGLLGVEWDKNILPPSFRGQVNNGDRVALFGSRPGS